MSAAARPMNVHRIYAKISAPFRRRRFERFLALFALERETTILDIGGYPWAWQALPAGRVTVLNPHRLQHSAAYRAACDLVVADGCALPFEDGAFDIVYSNSVIEHVGDWEAQRRFAAEAARVGRGLWIQTPAKEFPVEPHMLTPFIHWLPRACQRALLPYGAVRSWFPDPARPTWDDLKRLYDEISLLSKSRFRRLFPDTELLVERFGGCWPKSYVAYRPRTREGGEKTESIAGSPALQSRQPDAKA